MIVAAGVGAALLGILAGAFANSAIDRVRLETACAEPRATPTGSTPPPPSPTSAVATRIAMIDGGMGSHPSLSRASIEQRGFAGPAQPTGHGTAVGSLLVGTDGSFRGAATGAQLFVGDVYGGNASAGSASVIVRALAWAVSKRPSVINISLVGPSNALLQRAIASVRSKGIEVVAAVGNDGRVPAWYREAC